MFEKQIEEYFENNKDEILASLGEIMSIDSSFSQPDEGKPFGSGSARALEWAENFGKSIGLGVKNFDNYAVSMDYSDGEPVLGILSHLDVVPAGEGWTYPPFACTIENDTIYGRGSVDDKGPSVAVLYAVKCLRDLKIPLKKNFRLILGGNEEGGCEDIEYYQRKEKFPPMVITPDGSFPVLNCEKGMIHLEFSGSGSFDCSGLHFSEIKGGTVINAIPGKTVCKAECTDNSVFACLEGCDTGYTADGVVITGQSAHGSRPELGRNTVTALLRLLSELGNKTAKRLSDIFPHGEFNGKSAGMGFSDEVSGEMTCALTTLDYSDEKFTCGIDIRFPIDRTLDEMKKIIISTLEDAGMTIVSFDGMEPHYVPEESGLVQALLKTYEKVRGEKGFCIAEGGITYVHNTSGGVAFGAEFPDENNNMHGADEHISMETFKCNFLMYANAIIEICG